MPHAETHTIILPHALAYNAPKIPRVMEQLANVLPESNGDAIHGLNVLMARLKWRRGLKDFGFKDEDINKAADVAVSQPYYNPREVKRELVRELVRRAYAGEEARTDL
jgi:alcohol dehydrogenase class IV